MTLTVFPEQGAYVGSVVVLCNLMIRYLKVKVDIVL